MFVVYRNVCLILKKYQEAIRFMITFTIGFVLIILISNHTYECITYVCIYVYMYACMYVFTYTRMYAYISIYLYITEPRGALTTNSSSWKRSWSNGSYCIYISIYNWTDRCIDHELFKASFSNSKAFFRYLAARAGSSASRYVPPIHLTVDATFQKKPNAPRKQ